MKINSINNLSFQGKIKINASRNTSSEFGNKILSLQTQEAKNEQEKALKVISNKISRNGRIHTTHPQKDGFCYILTDSDAYQADLNDVHRYTGAHWSNPKKKAYSVVLAECEARIAEIVDNAELIGEIKFSYDVVV